DTVTNGPSFSAGSSRTQFYLSLDTVKSPDDRLLGGRTVPALGPDASSTGNTTLVIPTSMALGTYYLIACADDTGLVAESNEGDNCRAAARLVQVGRPDLVVSAIGDAPPVAVPGATVSLSDTVKNVSPLFAAGVSRVQYYLSVDGTRSSDAKLLGGRTLPSLAPNASSSGVVSGVVPGNIPLGTYHLVACADDGRTVAEADETNNCLVAAGLVQVGRPDLAAIAVSSPPANIAR